MLKTTTDAGTTVTIETFGRDRVVILTNPEAPGYLRRTEAGRVALGGFQPAPLAAWALSPEALRIIASLIEREVSGA